jgi:hypothetical protein
LGNWGSKGAIFFHCASVSNGPDRAISPPSALLTLLISDFPKLNHSHFKALSQVVQQLLIQASPLLRVESLIENTDCPHLRFVVASIQRSESVSSAGL